MRAIEFGKMATANFTPRLVMPARSFADSIESRPWSGYQWWPIPVPGCLPTPWRLEKRVFVLAITSIYGPEGIRFYTRSQKTVTPARLAGWYKEGAGPSISRRCKQAPPKLEAADMAAPRII